MTSDHLRVLRMRQPSMESLEEDPLTSPSPKKKAVLRPTKRASKDMYKSDSSISWIWETVDESDVESEYEEELITESPLAQEKLIKQKSMDWDMSIINGNVSDDEIYFDPSTKSLNKPCSRMNLTEKMSKSSSSLMSLDIFSVAEEKEDDPAEYSKENLTKSGVSLATAYVDDDETAVGVRFNPTPEVRLYITRDEYEEEEYFQCFYSSNESERMLQSRNKMIDKINKGKMKNPDTMRGLEYWVEATSSKIDRRVDLMIQKVMDEQDDQIERGVDDQFKLAELSLSVSVESMAVALKIAMRDAKVAKKAYRQMFEKQELDLQTFKSSSTDTTAAMSSVVLPESLEKSSSKHKRGKENENDVDESTRSNRSVSSRRRSRSKSKRDRKTKKQATAEDDNEDGETSQHDKKMKKRNSDTSKKSSKRKDLKKQTSERSVGSRKSASAKKKSKKKVKAKETILEGEEHVGNGEGEELEVPPASSSSKMKKRRSSESTKKKQRSSKGKKSSKRASETEIKVKKKPNNKDKRRSSAPADLLIKQKKRSSSSKNLVREDSDRSIDPKALTSSLSSEEDEHLRRTKEQSKLPASAPNNRRSFMESEVYKQMGTSWMQFLEDTGEDITRAALLAD